MMHKGQNSGQFAPGQRHWSLLQLRIRYGNSCPNQRWLHARKRSESIERNSQISQCARNSLGYQPCDASRFGGLPRSFLHAKGGLLGWPTKQEIDKKQTKYRGPHKAKTGQENERKTRRSQAAKTHSETERIEEVYHRLFVPGGSFQSG